MARYIVIDRYTGYVFGDTADIDGKVLSLGDTDEDVVEACRALDEAIGVHDHTYQFLSRSNVRALASNEDGYLVYRAHVNGSEAVPVVWDGQDRETIEAVERDCRLVGVVKCGKEC